MKETTGELNMTIVTIVAVSAIGALLWFVIWPMIQRMITDTTCKTYGEDWTAVKITGGSTQAVGQGNAQMSRYGCCPTVSGNLNPTWNDSTCIHPEK